jgi:hypothetical protein
MKKGILALVGVGAALTIPVVSTGGASAAAGGDDFEIRFTLKSFDGEPVALKRFRFSKLNGTCDGGVTVEVRGKFGTIEVNDRNRFSESIRREGRKVRVKGKVSGDLERVRGTIRATGDFPPDGENCDTGKVRWRASR